MLPDEAHALADVLPSELPEHCAPGPARPPSECFSLLGHDLPSCPSLTTSSSPTPSLQEVVHSETVLQLIRGLQEALLSHSLWDVGGKKEFKVGPGGQERQGGGGMESKLDGGCGG